ncbi:MAG: hypothetical protein LBJ16_01305 [Holosporaceae bacterium]|nr:hypothetical protein [Holosporaceae bacterium]
MLRFFLVAATAVCCFLVVDRAYAPIAESAVMSLSAASSLKSLDDKDFLGMGGVFASKEKVNLKTIVFDVEENMNHNGAVKLDLIIVYTQELVNKLSEMSSREYFRRKRQLKRDHPDKIKIYQWGIEAEKSLSKPIKIKHDTNALTPLAAFIFADFSSTGEHRHLVPEALENIKLVLKENDFELEQSDSDVEKKKKEKEGEDNDDDD